MGVGGEGELSIFEAVCHKGRGRDAGFFKRH